MINVPPSRDHDEVDLGNAAGVSDRGLRHHRNEDWMALASEVTSDGPVVVAVVCDGVSSSPRPDEASHVAAEAARQVLMDAVRDGRDLIEASQAAVAAARECVAQLKDPSHDTSATTFVSAVAAPGLVTLCWLGDSRAYWLTQPESESQQLTRDDSVAGGMVEAGLATEAAAMASPHAHVLTRWLGGDAADLDGDPKRAPHVEQYAPPGAGSLLLCSDGLWNYLSDAADLAELALPKALNDPLSAAVDLVQFALEAGGADNITAILIPYSAPQEP